MTLRNIQHIPLPLTKEDGFFRRMGYGGRSRPPAQEILSRFDRAIDTGVDRFSKVSMDFFRDFIF